jgi:hypothetical protein
MREQRFEYPFRCRNLNGLGTFSFAP